MAQLPAGAGRGRDADVVLRTLFDQSVAGIFVLDLDGRLVYINARFAELLGYAPEEMSGESYFAFVPDAEVAERRAGFELLAGGRVPSRQVVGAFQGRDGEIFELLTQSTLASYAGTPAIIGVAADVTARRRVERALERATNALRTLSAAKSALMRAQSESDLVQEMCTLALSTGAYTTAWIGMAEPDGEKRVRPVARAGAGTEGIEQLAVRWDDSAYGRGPTGMAIRTATPRIARNLDVELAPNNWERYHRDRGHRAIVALPLTDSGRAFGSLTLASRDPEAFDDEEVALLVQLASDISYGIIALRNREALRAAEQRSREHASRLEALWKIVNNPRLSGEELTQAMLAEAAGSIRPGQPYGAALFRIAGDDVMVEGVAQTPEYTALAGIQELQGGTRIPLAGTAVADVLAHGIGTRSWDDMQAVFSTPRIRKNGWRSAIVTTFESAGSTYLLWFASIVLTGAWEPQDHAYVEVMSSFFASQAQLRWQFAQIQYHQTHDVLTGVLNRSQFRSQARLAALRSDGFAVLLIKVNDLADLNAAHGTMIGDALLVEVAAGVCERVEPGELVGRVDGDVFAVFISGAASRDAARVRLARFEERFRQPFSTGDREGREFVDLTGTFALAAMPHHGRTIDELLAYAQAALATAKAAALPTVE